MNCFEVFVNGNKLCVAGIGDPGDLHINVIWVLRHSQFDYSGTPGTADETMTLSVGGKAYAKDEYLSWPDASLKTGDEVLIRVVERSTADEPAHSAEVAPVVANEIEARRRMYEKLKQFFEPDKSGGSDEKLRVSRRFSWPGAARAGGFAGPASSLRWCSGLRMSWWPAGLLA